MFKLPTKNELYNIILKDCCEAYRKSEDYCREKLENNIFRELCERNYYLKVLSNKFLYALQQDNVDLCSVQIDIEDDYYKITYYEVPEERLSDYPEYSKNTFSITIKCQGTITFNEKNQPEFRKLILI